MTDTSRDPKPPVPNPSATSDQPREQRRISAPPSNPGGKPPRTDLDELPWWLFPNSEGGDEHLFVYRMLRE